MKKPNFFIVGPGRSGTTALSEYLDSHPNVFMSIPKEPHYFCTDFPKIRKNKGFTELDSYLKLYEKCKPQHIAIGEASPSYIISSEALQNIYQFNPEAKIVVIVRNPIDKAYSHFINFKNNNLENQNYFETAWQLQDQRKQGQMLPSNNIEPITFQYGRLCKLAEPIERLFSLFPKQQIKVIIFDDFVNDTKKIYTEILSFLNINDDNRVKFPKAGESRISRFIWLNAFLRNPPLSLKFIVNGKLARNVKNKIVAQVDKWNTKAKPPLLEEKFRQELAKYFHDDVKKLSELLDKDLMHWVK